MLIVKPDESFSPNSSIPFSPLHQGPINKEILKILGAFITRIIIIKKGITSKEYIALSLTYGFHELLQKILGTYFCGFSSV